MKYFNQTRLNTPEKGIVGNCFPTCIACILDYDSPEDVLQFQEFYENPERDWFAELVNWLIPKGWILYTLNEHPMDDSYYMVSGMGSRGFHHICVYQNGKLIHDPHPSREGIIEESWICALFPYTSE